eukprot:Awhi_evm1s15715
MEISNFSVFLLLLCLFFAQVECTGRNSVELNGNFFTALGNGALQVDNVSSGNSIVITDLMDRISDLDIADGILFTLDFNARLVRSTLVSEILAQNFLVNAAQANSASITASVFSGISASGGKMVVSGGTTTVSIFNYDKLNGSLASVQSVAGGNRDLGIGQP